MALSHSFSNANSVVQVIVGHALYFRIHFQRGSAYQNLFCFLKKKPSTQNMLSIVK